MFVFVIVSVIFQITILVVRMSSDVTFQFKGKKALVTGAGQGIIYSFTVVV